LFVTKGEKYFIAIYDLDVVLDRFVFVCSEFG